MSFPFEIRLAAVAFVLLKPMTDRARIYFIPTFRYRVQLRKRSLLEIRIPLIASLPSPLSFPRVE